jgi:hypothetical protein
MSRGSHGAVGGAGTLYLENKGERGPCVRGDDTVTYFEAADNSNLDAIQTMCLWVYHNSSTWTMTALFQKTDFSGTAGGARFYTQGAANLGKLYWGGSGIPVAATIEPRQWHLFVYNGFVSAAPDIWVDGVLVHSALGIAYNYNNAYNLRIGMVGAAVVWQDTVWMSEVRGYDHKLTEDEILHQYRNPWDLYQTAIPVFWSIPVAEGGAQTVTLDTLTLAGSVPSMSVTPGAVSVAADTLTLASTIPNASVTPGAVTVTANTLTLAGSVEATAVLPGAVSVDVDTLTLSSSVPSSSVTIGAVTIVMNTLTLASTLIDIVVGGVAAAKKRVKSGWPFWRF